MTLSIHQYGRNFFPGTGALHDNGKEGGDGFAVNVPLPAHVGDGLYVTLFRMALTEVVRGFAPEVIVMQCGADTVYGDLLGALDLSSHAYATCIRTVLALGLPTAMLGGGGYNVFNTARCWAIATAVAVGRASTLPYFLPSADPYYNFYRCESPLSAPLMHVVSDCQPLGDWVAITTRICSHLAQQMNKVRTIRCSFPRTVIDTRNPPATATGDAGLEGCSATNVHQELCPSSQLLSNSGHEPPAAPSRTVVGDGCSAPTSAVSRKRLRDD